MSDSDGPPPLADSDDSDGPPSLVDSSSDGGVGANIGAAAAESESESSEDDDFDSFNHVFNQMALRAAAGPRWRTQVLQQGPMAMRSGRLALEDRNQDRSQECPRRLVQCPDCKETNIPFETLVDHQQNHCPAGLATCEICNQPVARGELESGQHMRNDCPKRLVECSGGCKWSGHFEDLEDHLFKCPAVIVDCPSCLAQMPRWAMRDHMCTLVDGQDDCIMCAEPLFFKPPVAVLMLNHRRACGHYNTCMSCAQEWMQTSYSMEARRVAERRHKDERIVPRCALCKAEYDTIAALDEHLLAPPEDPEAFIANLVAAHAAAAPVRASGIIENY